MQALLKLLKSQDGIFKINALKLTYSIEVRKGSARGHLVLLLVGFFLGYWLHRRLYLLKLQQVGHS